MSRVPEPPTRGEVVPEHLARIIRRNAELVAAAWAGDMRAVDELNRRSS